MNIEAIHKQEFIASNVRHNPEEGQMIDEKMAAGIGIMIREKR